MTPPIVVESVSESESLLATLEEFKDRYGFEGTADDEVLTDLLRHVTGLLAAAAGRICGGEETLLLAQRTHLFSAGQNQQSLWLHAWPVAAVTSVKEAADGAFADADELAEDDDFRIDAALGRLLRIGCGWLPGEAAIQVAYRAGFVPAGETAEEGETELPPELREACLQQAGYFWQRRASLGLSGGSAGQGGSVSWGGQDDLLPGVRAIVARYGRKMG